MNPEALITCCGLYGGTCARWCEYQPFRETARILTEWLDSQGYQYWFDDFVEAGNYDNFRKTLDYFAQEKSWLVCHKCCQGGDGYPQCEIRRCCRQRNIPLCFECEDFPCEKVAGNAELLSRADEYFLLGRKAWLKKQMEKARRGFELHTKKYYTVRAVEKNSKEKPDND